MAYNASHTKKSMILLMTQPKPKINCYIFYIIIQLLKINNRMYVSDMCNICKKNSDQMLMLSCVHDPCINCAASTFAEQVHVKGQNSDVYICEICGQETQLDSSTIAQLNNLAKSYVKMPTSIKVVNNASSRNKSFANSVSPGTKKKQGISQTNQQQQGQIGKKITYFCKEHSEQQISYYCFTCQANICPECAIHGKHKDHDVKLIKKALTEVKGDYLQIMNVISTSQNLMSKYKDNFLKNIKETNETSNIHKSLILKEFESIRTSLGVKEKQLLKNVDDLNKRNIQVLTNFLQMINVHYEQVTKVKKSIQLILRKDQVLIFQEFKKINQLDEKVKQTKQKSDQISGQLCFLNTQFLQQQIRVINDHVYKIKENVKKEDVGSQVYSGGGARSRMVDLNHGN